MQIKNRKKYISMALATIFAVAGVTQANNILAGAISIGPELLITEVHPYSGVVNDSYEYIELYNNTNTNIDLKNYKFPLENIDITTSKIIPSKSTIVLCLNSSTTLSNFNNFYGTSLNESKFLNLPLLNGILNNSSSDTIAIYKDDGTLISSASYGTSDFTTNKSITYKYPETGSTMVKIGQNQSPTPGEVNANQLPPVVVNVTGIYLDKTVLNMEVNQKSYLTATITPSNASNKTIIWRTGNANIAEVDQKGIITAKSEGAVLITATTQDGGFVATCTVIVKSVPVTGLTLDKVNLSLNKGQTATLKANITPVNATNKAVEWFSSNSSIASVDSKGVVTGKAEGSAIITAKSKDGNYIAPCTVVVKNIVADKEENTLKLNKSVLSIKEGKFKQLTPIFTGGHIKDKSVTWKSSNPSVATVAKNGKVIGLKEGTAVITVTTADGKYTAKCTVYVTSSKAKGNDKDNDNGKNKGIEKWGWYSK